MDILFVPLLRLGMAIINLYWWAVIIYIILSWLEQFQIINRYNRFVYLLHNFLFRLVEPPLTFFRRFVPTIGALDLSPLVLILFLFFIQEVLMRILRHFPA